LVSADLLLILVAAFGAGIVDSMVGGGGLVQVPALFTVYPAVPPAVLLGTNKLASIFGTSSAVLRFARRVQIPWRTLLPLVPVVFLGGLAGALAATLVPPAVFRPLVPIMLAVVLVYVVARKNLGAAHAPLMLTRGTTLIAATLLLVVGFYDGFFGPGTGSFMMLLLIRFYRFDFIHSAASARVLNVAANAGGLVYFASQVKLLWLVGGLMAVANVSGALLGSSLALKHGSGFVRRVFIAVVTVLIARTAWDAYFAP
jgi:uncharacterized membrane protein YfcA